MHISPAARPLVLRLLQRGAGRALALSLLVGSVAGCGRKATVEDCEQIVRRIAELELQGVVPQEELGSEVQEAQQSFRERTLADCVGRRITERSMACVAKAKTASAVIDECFD
jgi:hypothetical protein